MTDDAAHNREDEHRRRSRGGPGAAPARRSLAASGLGLATAACWLAWFAWDRQGDVDASGHRSGPYEPWQVAGCVVCLVALAVVARRWLPAAAVVVVIPVVFTAAWSVTAATTPSPDANLWPVGAVLVLLGTAAGSVVVTALATLSAHDRRPARRAGPSRRDVP